MKFRKIPVVIDAVQWNGENHPEVKDYPREAIERSIQVLCRHCGVSLYKHGWIETLEGGHIVCPGDWIIKGVNGEFYPCKPNIFEKTYEPAE